MGGLLERSSNFLPDFRAYLNLSLVDLHEVLQNSLGENRKSDGWGERIRTPVNGVRVRCPTTRRLPSEKMI